jgi:hypothetical protein
MNMGNLHKMHYRTSLSSCSCNLATTTDLSQGKLFSCVDSSWRRQQWNLCIIAFHHRRHLQPLVRSSGRASPASATSLHCLSPSAFIAADRTVIAAAASLPPHRSSAKHDSIRPC